MANILDMTAPMKLDSNEIYLAAAEELANLSEAEEDEHWRQAMQDEIKSIEEC